MVYGGSSNGSSCSSSHMRAGKTMHDLRSSSIPLLHKPATSTHFCRPQLPLHRTFWMKFSEQLHCTLWLRKLPTFKLSITLSNLNRFLKFLHCWKVPVYLPHLRHVATLPWEIKSSNFLQIFSRYGRKRKQIAF